MNALQEEAVSVLNGLISTCRDGQQGFRIASENVVDDPELKMLLSSFSLHRAKFAGELESLLIGMGEHHPENQGGTFAAAAHRGWMNIKTAVVGSGNHAILAECERGEDVAVSDYNEALLHEMPEPVREVVQKQRSEVITAHNTIRALRDASPNATVRASGIAKTASRKAGETGERIASSATEVWRDMKSKAGDVRKSTAVYVRRNPVPAFAGAMLAGFTLGIIIHALELRRERERFEAQRVPVRRMGAALAAWLGFAAGRARSGFEASAEVAQDLRKRAPKTVRRGSESFSHFVRNAWQRVAKSV